MAYMSEEGYNKLLADLKQLSRRYRRPAKNSQDKMVLTILSRNSMIYRRDTLPRAPAGFSA